MMMTHNDSDNDLQEPRIINIQPGGQAFETAGLRVGQVIQQVNDIHLKGWRLDTLTESDAFELTQNTQVTQCSVGLAKNMAKSSSSKS